MNSTLPDFLAAPAASAPGTAPFLATAVAGFLPAAGPDGPVDFAALMPTATPPAPTVTVQAVPTALPAVAPAAVAIAPVVVTMAAPTQRLAGHPVATDSVAPREAQPALSVPSGARRAGILAVTEQARSAGFAAPVAPVPENPATPAPAVPAEVPVELREQAVAFAVTLLQNLLPGVAVPAVAVTGGEIYAGVVLGHAADVAVPAVTVTGGQSPGRPAGGGHAASAGPAPQFSFPGTSLDQASRNTAATPVTEQGSPFALPAGSDFPAASAAADARPVAPTAGQGRVETEPQASAMLPNVPPASVAGSQGGPDVRASGVRAGFAVAADGGVELRIELPPAVTADEQSGGALSAGTPVEIRAELTQPGQPALRVEAAGFAVVETGAGPAGPRQENFAGKNRATRNAAATAGTSAERNFEFTGDKEVNTRSPEAGIAVAKTESIMSAAPTEEPRAARKPQDSSVLPVRAEFQVAQTPAERITAPAPGPAGQTFAERAVETVTGLVEAQFAASMQRSGSVHLRLTFGGEDLSVHVAIRDGAVHADFRTDSAPLRAALEHEWQAMAAASPEQMQRYADPVFSPGAGASHASSSPFGQGDFRQSAQQQAWSEQQQRAARDQADAHAGFSRRSLVSETFVPAPPAPRVPALLPTSLRLSALA